jgi:hypothetical protein
LQIANIPLTLPMTGSETPCAYDCLRSGWLQHSLDGRFVFVGDSGDVIDTGTRKTVATLPTMANSRQEIEIDFQNGVPVWAMNNRSSLGTVAGTNSSPPVITSATTAQGTFGQTFSYQITATNSPTSYGASPLPTGVSVNTSTGLISGTPSTAGTYTVTVSATNTSGTGTATLTINVASGGGGSSGGITLLQSNAVQGSSLGSISLSFPGPNTAGNLIVAFVRMSTSTQTVTVKDSAGNAYLKAVSQAQTADGHQVYILYAENIAGTANTVTATFSGTNNHPWLAIYEYSGLNATAPLDKTASAQGSSTSPSCGPTASTTAANELLFAGVGLVNNSTATITAGNGYTLQQQDTNTSRAANETAIVSSTGAQSAGFTLSSGGNWSCVLATFKQ